MVQPLLPRLAPRGCGVSGEGGGDPRFDLRVPPLRRPSAVVAWYPPARPAWQPGDVVLPPASSLPHEAEDAPDASGLPHEQDGDL